MIRWFITLMYKKIVIAGTPGVGKTSVAKALSDRIGGFHLDLSSFAISRNLILYYDEARESYVIDENWLVREVVEILKNVEIVVIDTHYPEIIPRDVIDIVFILRLHPNVLYERLRSRNWPIRKIKENVLAEALSIVALNALEHYGVEKVFEIDTTSLSIEEIVFTIINTMKGGRELEPGIRIDWLEKISPEDLDKFSDLGFNNEV
uniref:Putative adenylate kinase n=1 Tax=Staphylothermus marinus TaxID=2280 RepID=A0A7J3KGM8_STAMA